MHGYAKCLQLLVSRGADLTMRHEGGLTVLDWAKVHKHPECYELLKAAGAKHGVRDNQLFTMSKADEVCVNVFRFESIFLMYLPRSDSQVMKKLLQTEIKSIAKRLRSDCNLIAQRFRSDCNNFTTQRNRFTTASLPLSDRLATALQSLCICFLISLQSPCHCCDAV
jgi:ankyrin repeat protein